MHALGLVRINDGDLNVERIYDNHGQKILN